MKNNKRLYRKISAKITELLDSGEYPVGSRLPPERELSQRFTVSRPTIREAIIYLEALGSLKVKVGSGVYVAERPKSSNNLLQPRNSFELIEARVVIEGDIASLAAAVITDGEIKQLRGFVEDMRLENSENNLKHSIADRKFHNLIAQITKNNILIQIIQDLWELQESIEYIQLSRNNVCMQDKDQRIKEHIEIIDAMEEQNQEKARLAMYRHFTRLLKALHETNERIAVEEVKRKLELNKQRFSLSPFLKKNY